MKSVVFHLRNKRSSLEKIIKKITMKNHFIIGDQSLPDYYYLITTTTKINLAHK